MHAILHSRACTTHDRGQARKVDRLQTLTLWGRHDMLPVALPLAFLGAGKAHATQLRFVGHLLAALPPLELLVPGVVGRQIMVQKLPGGYILLVQLKPLQQPGGLQLLQGLPEVAVVAEGDVLLVGRVDRQALDVVALLIETELEVAPDGLARAQAILVVLGSSTTCSSEPSAATRAMALSWPLYTYLHNMMSALSAVSIVAEAP